MEDKDKMKSIKQGEHIFKISQEDYNELKEAYQNIQKGIG